MENSTEMVYKYRVWKDPNSKSVLLKNQLYFSSPLDFNDPFDCRISKTFSLLDSDEKIKTYVNRITIRNFSRLSDGHLNIEKVMLDLDNRLKYDLQKEQANWDKMHFERQDKYYGVLSLSCIWNNILMWSHYSDKHKGYCVGFHEEKIRSQANLKSFKAGKVLYDEVFPEIDPLDEDGIKNGYLETHTKAIEWKYEEEYRIFKLFYESETPPTKEERLYQVDDETFAELILGMNFPEDEIQTMKKIASQKGIPLYRAKKGHNRFCLLREQIS